VVFLCLPLALKAGVSFKPGLKAGPLLLQMHTVTA